MIRVGLFIGVDRTGDLTELRDAAACARRMYAWGIGQGMVDGETAILITDADGATVTAQAVKDAIQKLLKVVNVDQLIVYFAGHGVVIHQSEQWLLTKAPADGNAAINVATSVWQARFCGVPHVVFISDACRVAPNGVNAQNVAGQGIFPNDSDKPAHSVDQFFATSVGYTAAEARDPKAVATGYRSLYTEAMLNALTQPRLEAIDPEVAGAQQVYIRPPRLAAHLKQEVLRLIIAKNIADQVVQDPDSILPSAGVLPPVENWMARFDLPLPEAPPARPEAVGVPLSTRSFATKMVRSAIHDDIARATSAIQDGISPGMVKVATPVSDDWRTVATAQLAGIDRMARDAEAARTPFGIDHFETGTGIKVRGHAITDCFASAVQFTVLDRDIVRVNEVAGSAASVLLRFEGGSAAVVPIIPNFIVALTFTGDQLTDVAYEPSGPQTPGNESDRFKEFSGRAAEIRTLRGVAASMSRHGRFRIAGPDADQLARRMQYAKGLDPALALYAAYAYNDLQLTKRIVEMSGYLISDIGATFFDIELLAGRLLDRSFDRTTDASRRAQASVVPSFPMLAQGWNFVEPNRIELPKGLEGISRFVRQSLWTLFNSDGGDLLQRAITNGDLR